MLQSYKCSIDKGETTMTENEIQLLNLIRNNENPEQALVTAIQIITDYLKQSQSFAEPSVVYPQALS